MGYPDFPVELPLGHAKLIIHSREGDALIQITLRRRWGITQLRFGEEEERNGREFAPGQRGPVSVLLSNLTEEGQDLTGANAMQDFIRRKNIALFKKRLADSRIAEQERAVLLRLLAEEELKGYVRALRPRARGTEPAHSFVHCR